MQRCCKSDHRAADGRRKGREGGTIARERGRGEQGRTRTTNDNREREGHPSRPSVPRRSALTTVRTSARRSDSDSHSRGQPECRSGLDLCAEGGGREVGRNGLRKNVNGVQTRSQ